MKRIYKLNGQIVDLNAIMEHLQDLLENNGNTEIWTDFGIDFEDVNYRYAVNYMTTTENNDDTQFFETIKEARKCFDEEKQIAIKDHNDWKIVDNRDAVFAIQQQTMPYDYIQIWLAEL